jgi:putative OmpL-like beta-barrel porin-2
MSVHIVGMATLVSASALLALSGARADETAPPAAPAAPANWSDTIAWSGYIDAGITGNPQNPANDVNFGHLYTDRTDTPVLNQFALTVTRPLDPKATGYDFGFTLTGMVGTDARYTHFDGELDRTFSGRYQMTILEADALFHLPWLTDGGIDAKLGQFPSPMSAESINPTGNPLYSHSYIFNFGVTVSHTGFWTTTHVDPLLDIYLGIDSGNQTTLGSGDNNGAAAGLAGIGLNLLGGNLTVVGLSHFGPENPSGAGEPFNVNSEFRWYNDITTTWKATDALTFITDLNYVHDDGFKASGYGVAQYVTYALNDQVSLQGRGEVFWDPEGFFVAAFPGPLDAVNALEGKPNGSFGGGHTTYGEITLGLNYKPPVPDPFTGFVIRPEIRYDASLNGTHPFGTSTGTSGHQFTLATDFIVPF